MFVELPPTSKVVCLLDADGNIQRYITYLVYERSLYKMLERED